MKPTYTIRLYSVFDFIIHAISYDKKRLDQYIVIKRPFQAIFISSDFRLFFLFFYLLLVFNTVFNNFSVISWWPFHQLMCFLAFSNQYSTQDSINDGVKSEIRWKYCGKRWNCSSWAIFTFFHNVFKSPLLQRHKIASIV